MIAQEPFDDLIAGVTLHTHDGYDFYVHEAILSAASRKLKMKLETTEASVRYHQSTGQIIGAVKLLPVSINSATLDCVLRFCYPIPNPKVRDRTQLESMLFFANEHALEGVVSALEEEFIRLVDVNKEPLVAYAVGLRFKWIKLRDLATRASLLCTVDQLLHQGTSHADHYALQSLSQADYHRFLLFHYRCRERISQIYPSFHSLELWDSMKNDRSLERHTCHSGRWGRSHMLLPCWLIEWMENLGEAVSRGAACQDMKLARRERGLAQFKAMTVTSEGTCSACIDPKRNLSLNCMIHFLDDIIEEKVEQAIFEVHIHSS
ncbi:hypothetical protein ONZ45_g15514 [Pleurotus djamor]|nr:hypothetical protein ONZ45_g15514 [Pleurotus djamor]